MIEFRDYLQMRLRGEKPTLDDESGASTESDRKDTALGRERSLFDFLRADRIAGTISFSTAAGFAASLIYNFGYFSTFDRSILWLLTPGDYTSLAIPFIVSSFFFFFVAAMFFGFLFLIQYGIQIVFPSKVMNFWRERRKSRVDVDTKPKNRRRSKFWNAVIPWFFLPIYVGAFFWVYYSLLTTDVTHVSTLSVVAALAVVFLAVLFLLATVIFGGAFQLSSMHLWLVLVITLVPTTHFGGAVQGFRDLDAFEEMIGDTTCISVSEEISIEKECMIRALERGVLYRSTGEQTQDGSREYKIIFRFYDENTVINYPLRGERPTYWRDYYLFESLTLFDERINNRIAIREQRKAEQNLQNDGN